MRDQSGRACDRQRSDGCNRRALSASAVHAGPHLLRSVAADMTGSNTADAASSTPGGVTIVTQTRVRPGDEVTFSHWQKGTSEVIARFPGFIQQTVMPPSPPAQLDWVILQRFTHSDAATAW